MIDHSLTVSKSGAVLFAWLVLSAVSHAGDEQRPRSLDPRLSIELFAADPELVTPTGIDVDLFGRVWVIESNTHFPPEGYQGHPTDRVLVMNDDDTDGRADRIVEFTDGLTHAMSVAVRPSNDVYIATRREIFIYNDDNGDGKADRRKRTVHLETEGDYPHNGLAGFAFDALSWSYASVTSTPGNDSNAAAVAKKTAMTGWMYFGFGENLGADYRIIGSDGTTLSGGGEGGNIYRCRLDGSELSQWATGFWNPHASCIDAFGRLFTVDNDPDSLPPCRLLHIVPDGDYGYRFRNGRKGLHPFTAWNGEISGTLPMVAGTGEAPSGIVAYESNGLPEDYLGNLLVTSWGDHRVDRFRLKPNGASFTSLPEPLIQGGEKFRPVGLAVAPDGSLYLTDWVLRDYKVHGHGRVWRIAAADSAERTAMEMRTLSSRAVQDLLPLLEDRRIDVRRGAGEALRHMADGRSAMKTALKAEQSSVRACLSILNRLAHVPGHVENLELFIPVPTLINVDDWPPEVQSVWLQLVADPTPQKPFNATDARDAADLGAAIFTRYDPANSGEQSRRLENPDLRVSCASLINDIRDVHGVFIERELREQILNRFFERSDPFEFQMISQRAFRGCRLGELQRWVDPGRTKGARSRLAAFLAARQQFPHVGSLVSRGLSDPDPQIRRVTVQWVAEERLTHFRPQLEGLLNGEGLTTDLFRAVLAAIEMLDGIEPKNIDETPAAKYVVPLVHNENSSPKVRVQALRLISPSDPALNAVFLRELLASDDAMLKLEAVRTLQFSPIDEAGKLLNVIASDSKQSNQLRAEAVVGLAGAAKLAMDGSARATLKQLLDAETQELQVESVRAMRGLTKDDELLHAAVIRRIEKLCTEEQKHKSLNEQIAMLVADGQIRLPTDLAWTPPERPRNEEEWRHALSIMNGDSQAGRRAFFHVNGAGCYKCHTVNGRGGRVGPDLSQVGRSLNRKRLIDSILNPSKEIAPQFTTWTMVTESGTVQNGMIVQENRGTLRLGNADGLVIDLQTIDIVERKAQKTSLMPQNLVDSLTISELSDLLAFLESLQ